MLSKALTRRMEDCLADLERESQLRELRVDAGVNLTSNDYLGLAGDPRLKAALLEGIEECKRTGSTGSRLLSGHDAAWDELEDEFAAFAGTESSLFFSSGFAANTGLLSALLGKDDLVFSDALNHASIVDGIRLSRAKKVIYPHADLDTLEQALRANQHHPGARVIVTESIFSMDGDRAPLPEIFHLAGRYGAELIVDEAHATGVCGPAGRGLTAELGLQPLAIVHTCGKALASMGAFVCGSRLLRKFLINRARTFIFSTAMPAYFAKQIRAALALAASMEAERRYLASLAASLRSKLLQLGCSCGSSRSHIVPIIVGNNAATLTFATVLNEQGFAVRAIRPPTVPVGTARVRLSLTAALTTSKIEQLTAAIASASGLHHA
jgi:8-amino-7-oxononanoate synthase